MTRFVTIAVVLALTSTAAGAQNAAPLTPQQKQDLTGYNFKGAETRFKHKRISLRPSSNRLRRFLRSQFRKSVCRRLSAAFLLDRHPNRRPQRKKAQPSR